MITDRLIWISIFLPIYNNLSEVKPVISNFTDADPVRGMVKCTYLMCAVVLWAVSIAICELVTKIYALKKVSPWRHVQFEFWFWNLRYSMWF